MIYLDNSATTKTYDEVVRVMSTVLEENYGNPSALHDMGLMAEKRVKRARESLAQAMGLGSGGLQGQVIFSSGGTESDNMAIICGSRAKRRRGNTIICSPLEHPAVLETCKFLEGEGFHIAYMSVDSEGRVDPSSLDELLSEDVIMVSCMHVNNETGAVQPLEEIGRIKSGYEKRSGREILFHVDAVQSFGKIYGKYEAIPTYADLITVSSHKIHGPKGVGALFIRKDLALPPLIHGGGQENGFRSGTENVMGIAGFGEAAEIAAAGLIERLERAKRLKRALLEGILREVDDVKINGSPETEKTSPFILNVSFLGVRGEVLLHDLERRGIMVSTGSACSSKKRGYSHVLKAMGLSEKEAEGAIRFSLSEFNTMSEMECTVDAVKDSVSGFRNLGRYR